MNADVSLINSWFLHDRKSFWWFVLASVVVGVAARSAMIVVFDWDLTSAHP